jgi:ankyrin repeat protein
MARSESMLRIVLCAVLTLMPAVHAADDTEPARLALRTKQFAQAIASLQPLAARGDADAQYLLGLAIQNGVGIAQDPATARRWLQAAADQKHAAAAFALAGALAVDPAAARTDVNRWLEVSAALGYPAAIEAKQNGTIPLQARLPQADAGVTLRLDFAMWAARSNDTAGLEHLGVRNVVDLRDAFQRTPLMAAVEAGARSTTALLVQAGADVNAVDRGGVSVLMLGAAQKDIEITRSLLSAGARLNARDATGRTPLMHASWADLAEQIVVLTATRAELDLTDERGWTALDIAIQRERAAAAAALRARGATARLGQAAQARSSAEFDPARTGVLYQGWQPLLVAVTRNDVDAMRKLRAAGADVNVATAAGDTALHVAVESRAREALKELLLAGADGSRRNRAGETAFGVAVRRGDVIAATALKANVAKAELDRGVLTAASTGDLAMTQWLLADGADENAVDGNKDTALMLAVRSAQPAVVEALLAAGAKPQEGDARGRTPLWQAAAAGERDTVTALLRARATVDAADADGATPLMAAASGGHVAVVEALLAAGAAVAHRGRHGDTPLHAAAGSGRAEVMRVLLRQKPAVDVANEFGDTPLILASRLGSPELCDLLLAAGANARLRNRDRLSASEAAEARGFAQLARRLAGN